VWAIHVERKKVLKPGESSLDSASRLLYFFRKFPPEL